MQLLNSRKFQLTQLPEQLQDSLQDMVSHIQIESYYSIKHTRYKHSILPDSVTSQFERLPLEIQQQHLKLQLRNFIYNNYYNVNIKNKSSTDENIDSSKLNKQLENNSLFGVDLEFYDRLHNGNKGKGYWSHNWEIVKEETDGTLAVYKNGLTLHIDPNLHLSPTTQSLSAGKTISVKMPKNLVQNGFYMAVANAGTQNNQEITRIYFNIAAEGAATVMESVTEYLNDLDISFSFKALYNPGDYQRYDSAVLYFNKSQHQIVWPVLQKVYAENELYFQQQVPMFTKILAPGLGCAEEPEQKFGDQESFGTHRCQIIANGLIEAWLAGDHTPEDRISAIFKQFALQNIQLQHPYLNPHSQDIYTPFF
ncbi:hypothetical protein CEP10_12480 [Cylindrospermopsis raciborskii S07]|uniref:Uncharacterized protein n=3 Tax=Cylindrospermopsis raciborskii TaxID=77022 RepID=A0A853M9Z7_9CYAN|nr:T3SS effector HopA1 family protein [Cylindrospermopsis raciborskii]EFA68524.1 conserved hypothetical protein [Cylindrospermopsis raciborskii CS-505]MBA4445003.1 hypothetical protein [Cylindrospermopsis raciborskii CS-506_C]MBA4449223.1 hypothetical protein [Cylindrospermopsis raciborskii CS-506_D]MBA4455864.1 hypothetical protein [Cylindrospermopsis raciborskii CS-506_B]MBA4465205.1 hypothetical protein [Cylindrospermopsis raciborskii CS-506_A]